MLRRAGTLSLVVAEPGYGPVSQMINNGGQAQTYHLAQSRHKPEAY